MRTGSRWLRLAAVCTALVCAAAAAGAREVSADAQRVIAWVKSSKDNSGRPFAVVDKRNAKLYVFGADGRLAGQTTALLGQAVGDDIAPEVGAHAQSGHVPVAERTTPAGRFEAAPGRNDHGEPIVWVDYDSAFAIHRVRPGRTWKMRADRLASANPADKRVSWGCVVVPVDFYERVVQPVLGTARSVVYVLPETRPLASLLPAA